MTQAVKIKGPSGFIETGGNLLVVDYGKIYQNGITVGFLFEDGFIQGSGEPLGIWDGLKTIEELPGCIFKGIDNQGSPLELPAKQRGPTGGLSYNTVPYNVVFGRISTGDHQLIGWMDDQGTIIFKDPRFPNTNRKMDESCQLHTIFQGVKSTQDPWQYEYIRSLHKADCAYWENEVIRYFEDIDRISTSQKKYVFETMKLFGSSGLLQIVRKTQGSAGLGNVKHGATGVTGVRSGNVNLDKEEFEKEVNWYKKHGSLMAVPLRLKPYIEVRLNMVVAHEYGHQLEFCLSQGTIDQIKEFYTQRMKTCNSLYPLPQNYEGSSEVIMPNQIDKRIFISGYARSNVNEYWAEAVGAFAVRESRETLKQIDKSIYNLLCDVIKQPEKMLSINLQESILNLQTSLHVGGELTDKVLHF